MYSYSKDGVMCIDKVIDFVYVLNSKGGFSVDLDWFFNVEIWSVNGEMVWEVYI